jgi:hypothetical protein
MINNQPLILLALGMFKEEGKGLSAFNRLLTHFHFFKPRCVINFRRQDALKVIKVLEIYFWDLNKRLEK